MHHHSHGTVCPNSWQVFGDIVWQGIVPELYNHLEPGIAPRGWWKGLGWVFPRVLVTTGEHEGIVDPIQKTGVVIAENTSPTCGQECSTQITPTLVQTR